MSFLAKLQLGSTEYNVLTLEYKIAQNVDQQGKPDGKPKGGFIYLTVESSNKNDLAEWAISPTMTKTGTLTFIRRDTNSAMKTVSFQDAFCTGYKELFDARDENPMRIDLVISAGAISINSEKVTRPWGTEMAVVATATVEVAEVLSGREEDVVEKDAVVEENEVATNDNETQKIDGPRYGERRIPDELYDELREQTPSQEIRDKVNEGIEPPIPDPVLPGLVITKKLHADHIVSMDKITKMEGFDRLKMEQKLEVLNNPINFIGLSESANCSKGSKSFEEWKRHKSKGIDVNPAFRKEMIEKETQIQVEIQKQIDQFNLNNK